MEQQTTITFSRGDRIRHKVSGREGTVTMGGRTVVQVRFDKAPDSPVARFTKDLERI